jgi:hypothetical protein
MEERENQNKEQIVINSGQLDSKFKRYFKKNKKIIIIIGSIILAIIVLSAIGFFFLRHEKPQTTQTTNIEQPEVVVTETPMTYANVLDGLMVDKDSSTRHPLGVIVENHVDARPQAGLDKASVVYEAIAEGGITRFLALFSTHQAEKVGPIRSVRTYFVDWAHGYNAYIAHVGGNMDALDKIKAEKTYDLDQFAYSKPYAREYAAGLASEHTMYSSTEKLWEQAATNGYPTENNFAVYKFKDAADPTLVLPEKQRINVDFSSASYDVYFDYDKATNSYKRFQGGKAHVDKITKDQISPKNIIVMTVNRKAVTTRINEAGFQMTTVGSGSAKIFLDGKTITGTWKKNSASDREIFYDENNQEIIFNRGQFWICVIPPESSVTVQ